VIKRLLKEKNLVLATGGGSFMQSAVREEIGKRATTVWLRADLPVLLERVSRRDTRPLLATGDKGKILSKLMKERYPVYQEADIVIDSDDGPHEKVVQRIVKLLKKRDDIFAA
jgi:shikimate kinase